MTDKQKEMPSLPIKATEYHPVVGARVWTAQVGEWPGGPSTIVEVAPDPGAPEILFNVRHDDPWTDSKFGAMGIFDDEWITPMEAA